MTHLPQAVRRRAHHEVWPERLLEEIRRREKVVRISPNMRSAWRLIGALCAEQHEDWAHGRKYLTMEEYFRWTANLTKLSAPCEDASKLPRRDNPDA